MALLSRPHRKTFKPLKKETAHNINEFIKGREVQLVGDNVEPGVYPIALARQIAHELNLDLVELNQTNNMPLCRIMNYSKFIYEKKRREKEIKAKSKAVEVKEIRFTAETDEHDFNFKVKHAKVFLEDGNKVKACVIFRGRAINFQERGELLLLKLAETLTEVGQLEGLPKMEGKKMLAILVPKKKTKS